MRRVIISLVAITTLLVLSACFENPVSDEAKTIQDDSTTPIDTNLVLIPDSIDNIIDIDLDTGTVDPDGNVTGAWISLDSSTVFEFKNSQLIAYSYNALDSTYITQDAVAFSYYSPFVSFNTAKDTLSYGYSTTTAMKFISYDREIPVAHWVISSSFKIGVEDTTNQIGDDTTTQNSEDTTEEVTQDTLVQVVEDTIGQSTTDTTVKAEEDQMSETYILVADESYNWDKKYVSSVDCNILSFKASSVVRFSNGKDPQKGIYSTNENTVTFNWTYSIEYSGDTLILVDGSYLAYYIPYSGLIPHPTWSETANNIDTLITIDTLPDPVLLEKDLIGTWSGDNEQEGTKWRQTITFNSDGSMTSKALYLEFEGFDGETLKGAELDVFLSEYDIENPYLASGTWRVEDNNLLTTIDGETSSDKCSIVGNVMTVESGDMVMELQKMDAILYN